MPPLSTNRALLLLLFVVLLWGINWPIMKTGIQYIPPLWLAFMRVAIAAILLFALIGAQGRLRLPDREDWWLVLILGGLQIGAATGLVNLGLMVVDAGRSAILTYTSPIWVLPLAVVFLGERPPILKLTGLAVGLAGILVLFNPAAFDWRDPATVLGNAVLLVTAMIFAGCIVYVRSYPRAFSPYLLVPWQMTVGAVALLIAAIGVEGWPTIEWTPTAFAVLAYNGPVASAFCFWGYTTVSRALPATTTALVSLGAPVAGLLSSVVFTGEIASSEKILGLAIICVGVGLGIFSDQRENKRQKPASPLP